MDIHVQLGDNCIVFGTFTASRFYRSNQKRYMERQAIQWAMKKKSKRTNNDLQSTTQKTRNRAKRTPQNHRWTQVIQS
jgi:hypothetical protein